MSAAGNEGAVSEVDACLSDERVDVHILVVPVVAWRSDLRFAYSSVCLESASAGFVRVDIYTNLVSLREEIASQLSPSLLPGQYVFLRSLGRCFSWISCKQEEAMTVSMFVPPMTASPEVYVLDAACFHGFPEGVVETYHGVVNDSQQSFPIGHNRLMSAMETHPQSQPINQAVSLSPCSNHRLVMQSHDPTRSHDVKRSHDPTRSHNPTRSHYPTRSHDLMRSHDATRSHDAMRSHDALPVNFISSNRRIAQQKLPNLLLQQQLLQHQRTAPRQQTGSDAMQHISYSISQQDHYDTTNASIIQPNYSQYSSPSKAESNSDSINSLSDHSYVSDGLHQESVMLATSYGPNWQSSATQSLVVAESVANSLCSTTLSSSLNGAHHSYSPTKSMVTTPNTLRDGNSSTSTMLGPRVNVDLNLADSVITENTEVLERALFGSRGDGEGSSLTNSLLNVTGATSGYHLQQHNQSQLQDYNHAPLHSNVQPHPQLVLQHTSSGGHGDQQGHHSSVHHDDINTRSPSNHATNENAGLSHLATLTPHGYNRTVSSNHDNSTVSGDTSTVSNRSTSLGDRIDMTSSHSSVAEQNVDHSGVQSTNMSHNPPLSKSNRGHPSVINSTSGNNEPPVSHIGTPAANGTATNKNPSNILLTASSGHLSSNVNVTASQGATANNDATGVNLGSSEVIIPSEHEYNRNQLLQQTSDLMAIRSSVEGDGCSQSRADITATVSNIVTTSHDPSKHHVSTADEEHQLEHTMVGATTNSDGQLIEQTNVVGSSLQNLSLPTSYSQQPLLTAKETCTVSEDGTVDSDKVVNQQSPLSQREAGVGTSMLFSTSPLPPITSSSEKSSSVSEDVASGKPAELLDEVNQLLAQLRMVRDDRRTLESVKKGLSDTVKKLQRDKKAAQDKDDKKWKKMYFQERKLVQTNEDRLRRLRNEVYRRIGTMPTTSQQETPIRGVHQILSPIAMCEGPSEALNVKIQCARVEQNLTKLRQRLLAAQEKLKVEKEARILAEAENRTIRKNVLQQKINCTLTRTI